MTDRLTNAPSHSKSNYLSFSALAKDRSLGITTVLTAIALLITSGIVAGSWMDSRKHTFVESIPQPGPQPGTPVPASPVDQLLARNAQLESEIKLLKSELNQIDASLANLLGPTHSNLDEIIKSLKGLKP
jgi:hypothetical protein